MQVVLQAYATQQILRSDGRDVLILEYHPSKRIILARKSFTDIPLFYRRLQDIFD